MCLLPLSLRFILWKPLKITAVLYQILSSLFEREVLQQAIQI